MVLLIFKLRQGASIIRYVGRLVGLSVGRSVGRSVRLSKKFYTFKMTIMIKSKEMKITQEHIWTLNLLAISVPTPC